MPLAINTVTGLIRDYPLNVIQHRKLGRNLELYVEPSEGDEVEEDKVVIAKKTYHKKSEAVAEDKTTEEYPVTVFDEVSD
jgi:hypothetical protein